MTIDSLRKSTHPETKALLSRIWNDYVKAKEWPATRAIQSPLPKADFDKKHPDLNGGLLYELDKNGEPLYELTPVGILLTDAGERIEALLLRYLEYLRKLYVEDPAKQEISMSDVISEMGLDADEAIFLGKVVLRFNLFSKFASVDLNDYWRAGVYRESGNFPVGSLFPVLEALVFSTYNPEMPISYVERISWSAARSLAGGPRQGLRTVAQPTAKPPVAFVSYSHDSEEHKEWVADLVDALIEKGVEVLCDCYDVDRGDDLGRFMTRALREANWILMVCTENYVRKVEDGTGGVGFEAQIVTAQMIRNNGQNRFIPVIRQPDGRCIKPDILEAKLHVDMSDDALFPQKLEELLRTLHKSPKRRKPVLGAAPFSEETARPAAGPPAPATLPPPVRTGHPEFLPPRASALPEPVRAKAESAQILESPAEVYRHASDLAREDDSVGWRRFAGALQSDVGNRWMAAMERIRKGEPVRLENQLPDYVGGAVEAVLPLMACALAGVDSGKPGFSRQVGFIDDILRPKEWPRSGASVLVELPLAAGFVFHNIHGGLAMATGQSSLALALANTPVAVHNPQVLSPLCMERGVTSYLTSLGTPIWAGNAFLTTSPTRWPWLLEPFRDQENYEASIMAYHLLLHIQELARAVKENPVLSAEGWRVVTPLWFLAAKREVAERAYRMIISWPEQVTLAWAGQGVTRQTMATNWARWLELSLEWFGKAYHRHLYDRDVPIHANLFTDLQVI